MTRTTSTRHGSAEPSVAKLRRLVAAARRMLAHRVLLENRWRQKARFIDDTAGSGLAHRLIGRRVVARSSAPALNGWEPSATTCKPASRHVGP
jgi:hypothetical protein